MLKKNMKDFEIVVNAVAEALDLLPCEILNKRRFPEAVDARRMVVRLLAERGFYVHQIASWMGMTPRNVNAILTAVNERLDCDANFGRNMDAARKKVRNYSI